MPEIKVEHVKHDGAREFWCDGFSAIVPDDLAGSAKDRQSRIAKIDWVAATYSVREIDAMIAVLVSAKGYAEASIAANAEVK